MTGDNLDEIRSCLRLLLETDALMGLRDVPLSAEAARRLVVNEQPATPRRAEGGRSGALGAQPRTSASTATRSPATSGGASPRGGVSRSKPSSSASAGAVGGSRQAAAVSSVRPAGGAAGGPSGASGGPAAAERAARLQLLDEQQVKVCRKCSLCETRTQTVFGQGSATARLVFVGEGPGFEEDRQGLAFVGRAGQLLTKMLEAMGLSRDEVFICNVVKCRPPDNRTPATDEIAACSPYLFEQLQIIQPEVLCALGAPAAQTLLRSTDGIGRLRGRFHEFYMSGTPNEGEAIPLMPTYHPAYLLRVPTDKSKAWADLQLIMKRLGLG